MNHQKGFVHIVVVILISVMAIGLVGAAWYYEMNKEEATTNTIIQNNTNSLENSLKSSNTNSVVNNNFQVLYEYSKFYPEEVRKIYRASFRWFQ